MWVPCTTDPGGDGLRAWWRQANLYHTDALARSREPGRDLHHVPGVAGGRIGRTGIGAAWGHRLGDRHDPPLLVDPDDVEGDERVLHPERIEASLLEDEEHALVRPEGLAEHQPVLDGLGRVDDL